MNEKNVLVEEISSLPMEGFDYEHILSMMQQLSQEDVNFKEGRTWSLVYHAGEEHTNFLKRAFGLFFETNGLNPMAFRSLKRFEHDVVRMTADMLNAPPEAVGTMSAGGTESIILAVKTYRDMARKKKPWILHPNIIAPKSVHVAFSKACEYLDVKLILAPMADDFRVDTKAVKKLINRNTILLVGSAPSYPYGVIDPIEELGEIAQKKKIPLHVDACLGGFMLPFVERLGYDVPPFDFRIPAVTSMSADVHKYGYSAKGASVILYRSMDYLQHQFFIDVDWTGGIFASAGILGTRPGGSIAAAWAAMLSFGVEGYTRMAADTMRTTKKIIEAIEQIPELEILGSPHMSVFAYRSKDPRVNIYAVGDIMEERGWHIDRLPNPPALHAMVSAAHSDVADVYINDLKEAVEEVKRNPERAESGSAPMYGLMAKMPLRGMVKKNVLEIMKQMYSPQGKMPDLDADGDAASDRMVRLGLRMVEILDRIKSFRK